MGDATLIIGGVARAAAGGRTFERRHPLGAEPTRAAAAEPADAIAAADAAAAALPGWSALGPTARRAALTKAADALAANGDAFVAAMIGETGSTEGWARFNLTLAVGMCARRRR